eukprot:6003223-Amphidinium_carterae.1
MGKLGVPYDMTIAANHNCSRMDELILQSAARVASRSMAEKTVVMTTTSGDYLQITELWLLKLFEVNNAILPLVGALDWPAYKQLSKLGVEV